MIFLWVFLPAVILGNWILTLLFFRSRNARITAKNIFLLAASLFFYGWSGIWYLLLMGASITLNYAGGRLLSRDSRPESARRRCLFGIVFLNLLLLFVFKYFNLAVIITENLISGTPASIPGMTGTGALGLPEIALPVGISFFTFQAMSYVIDVYRRDVPVQKSFSAFALYVSFFPQLIAGPIVRYHEIADQITGRQESAQKRAKGVRRFCYGLGKKVLLANTLASAADKIWALDIGQITGLTAWLGTLCYTLQIYYDFSGYSDMAIGLGSMFGFRFHENFHYPYTSGSIQEFWRRWHISLSGWFREYVYIPLGGNRKGLCRTILNILIVFLLTGVWHGANFTFFAWGLYYGVILILERLFLGFLLKKNPIRILNHVYTMTVVMVGWILFRSDTLPEAFSIIRGLFVFGENDLLVMSLLNMRLIIFLVIGILFCGPVQKQMYFWYRRRKDRALTDAADFLLQLAILALSVLSLAGGSYNPFIYFQF